ncbi:SMYD1, partial [Symbiodinium microadriaticum]
RDTLARSLRCDKDSSKGRILVAERTFRCGDRLFEELPLHLVAESPKDPAFVQLKRLSKLRGFVHAPLWYWAALNSLSGADCTGCSVKLTPVDAEKQQRLLMLFHPEPQAPSEDCKAIVDEFWSGLGPAAKAALGLKLESLLAVWLLNCFEHSEEPVGFSTFFLPAFVSHDCRPNCMWHYEGDSFVMRARRDIPQGEEITVSYLAEESLLESTASRRAQLEATKHFLCNCATCSQALDPVRGFRCPGCGKGDIFLEMVMGSLQPSPRGACGVCGFLPTEAQAKEMIDQEARVEECVQEWDRKVNNAATYLPQDTALRLEKNMAGLFADGHWLRDRVARHLVSFYEALGAAEEALTFARRCVDFAAKVSCPSQPREQARQVYPGFSALHAWSLETQGDLILRVAGFGVGPDHVEAPGSVDASVCREVTGVYSEAAEALWALFGADHEFYVAIRDKRDALRELCTANGRHSPKDVTNRAKPEETW